jgi:hypothetical protein
MKVGLQQLAASFKKRTLDLEFEKKNILGFWDMTGCKLVITFRMSLLLQLSG